jgi:hypothetical protein
MKRITELTQTRWRTFHYRDDNGNLIKDEEEYTANHIVKTVSPGLRFCYFIYRFNSF